MSHRPPSSSSLCLVAALALAVAAPAALADGEGCNAGVVFLDLDQDGERDAGEPGLAGIAVSDGEILVRTDAGGRYALPLRPGRTTFVVKPPGHAFATRRDGLPDFWRHVQPAPGPALKHGGIPAAPVDCRDFALRAAEPRPTGLEVLLFGDPQPKTVRDVDLYWRDIVQPLVGRHGAGLGLTLGDLVDDDLSLYPQLLRTTMSLGVPWLHVPGNHDLDFDAAGDAGSLATYRAHFGPDTWAWEEDEAVFIGLDDVIYLPGQRPAYVGGLREDQFAFLEAYLSSLPDDRRLYLALHIPLADTAGPGEAPTFRAADRERLFALLSRFQRVQVLSAHGHVQRQFRHGPEAGWHGAAPLLEHNLGAACGAYWSGVPDAEGIPASTMADGTPNGYATLALAPRVEPVLAWHVARLPDGDPARNHVMSLSAPAVLRRGAYPAYGVYANVYLGDANTVVEYAVDDGEWRPMRRVLAPDPALVRENVADDLAAGLRGYDRSPEAQPSTHLWRGTLPTDLATGEHRVRVRTTDALRGVVEASLVYRLDDASP